MNYLDYNNHGLWELDYVHTPVGYVRYYGPEEHYPFYYIRDHLGNVREVWVHPWLNHSEYVQRTQYYPSGLPWNEGYSPSEQPYKYGGKEFVEMHGLDEYDSQARWYYPSIMRTTTMDPLCEKYPDISPYAWCGNNPVKNVDPTGCDIWELDSTGYIVHKIANKTQDAFRMNGNQISFDYGSVINTNQDDYQTVFSFENENVAANAFKFMADNSGVEYALVNSSKNSTIVTIHDSGRVNINRIIKLAIGGENIVTSIIHNHPNNTGPSGFIENKGDRPLLQKYENKLGYMIEAYVYQPDKNSLLFYTSSSKHANGIDWNYIYPNIGIQSKEQLSWIYRIKKILRIR